MGFFSKLMGRQEPSPQEVMARSIGNLQGRIAALYGLASAIDTECGLSDEFGLSACLRMDLLSFALHIAASDGVLEPSEVIAINGLLGSNFSYADCKEIIETTEFASKSFNQTPPATFTLLSEVARGHEIGARGFAKAMVATYEEIGMIVSMIDGEVDSRERRNLEDFVSMLNRQADTL